MPDYINAFSGINKVFIKLKALWYWVKHPDFFSQLFKSLAKFFKKNLKQEYLEFQEKKTLPAEVAADENVTLLKPQTFMNLSGEAVSAFLNKNHLPEKNILVIFDDADLPFGEIRYRDSGSAGGHHGLEDILNKTKKDSEIFCRGGCGRSRLRFLRARGSGS